MAGGVAVLGALPAAIGAWPVAQSGIAADVLLGRIRHSDTVAYHGYAESEGSLALPVTRQFQNVGDLLGGTAQLRVWYRDALHWRVDAIDLTGETDVHRGPDGSWTWNYESNRATWTRQVGVSAPVRLPAAADMVPANLARRLLSQARPGEVSRLPAKRVAGRDAAGVRLVPHDAASTIAHVDVWADTSSGLPLRVDVYGKGESGAVVTTRFIDVSLRAPAQSVLTFSPPPTARVRFQDEPDIAAAIDQLGYPTPPARLAGLRRNGDLHSFGAVGVYGSGVTELAAVPLPDNVSYALRRQIYDTAVEAPAGLEVGVGPLNLLLTPPDFTGMSWLLTGTVTLDTLATASAQLTSGQ